MYRLAGIIEMYLISKNKYNQYTRNCNNLNKMCNHKKSKRKHLLIL